MGEVNTDVSEATVKCIYGLVAEQVGSVISEFKVDTYPPRSWADLPGDTQVYWRIKINGVMLEAFIKGLQQN